MFSAWIQSVALDIYIFITHIFLNYQFISFVIGFIFAALLIGFIVTRDAKHIPLILLYSAEDSYQYIITHHPTSRIGKKAYHEFLKTYILLRFCFSFIFFLFFIFVIVTLVSRW